MAASVLATAWESGQRRAGCHPPVDPFTHTSSHASWLPSHLNASTRLFNKGWVSICYGEAQCMDGVNTGHHRPLHTPSPSPQIHLRSPLEYDQEH